MVEIVRCKRCGRKLTSKESIERQYGSTCSKIMQLHQVKEPEQPEQLDMNEIKTFITSEIQKALKDFNFNREIKHNDNSENNGINPVRITNMPKFNPIEANKRLVVKELKEQLQKGINNILQEVGSFDEHINFLERPVGILA